MAGPARLDRLERVTDLVLVLLHTEHPLTLDSIALQVPGYPEEHAARRQAFERDKRLLRDEGIPVLTQRLDGQEQYGYQIDRESFYLPDLELEADEQVALHLAVAGVHLGDPSGRDALMKLGATGLGEVRPIATLAPPRALVDLFEAVRTKARSTFTYRNVERTVAPAGLWFRFGHWYLVAWDLEREAVRTFRVDRVVGGVSLGTPGEAEVPVGLNVRQALPDDPWRTEGEDLVATRIRVDALEGPRVAEEVGVDKVEVQHADGSVELCLRVLNFPAIRSWVLSLFTHAEILSPPEFRTEMVEWLRGMTAGASVVLPDGPMVPAETEPLAAERSVPGQQTSQRLRRLLAIVGWLAQVGEAEISDIAQRFTINEDELVRELELAACCGVPPYTPDTLMEIEVSETTVRAFLPAEFARPRRLTPAEGFAVAASARLILTVPGPDDDALRRALTKLEVALGSHELMGVDVDVPPHLVQIRDAVTAGVAIEIDYHSASRDESTTRTVDPVQVVAMDGHWYVDAFCHRAGDMRRFRIDRISDVRVSGESAAATDVVARSAEDSYLPGPGALEVELRTEGGARWVAESIPVRSVTSSADGSVVDVVLNVTGMAWFERLLLQLGPEAEVLRPDEMTGVAAGAAEQVLQAYLGGN
jgi:predicted DNA-binding transcriptional regulator YafY